MMEQASRTRLVTVLVLVAVFGSGVLLGLAADFSLDAAAVETAPESSEAEETEKPRRRRFYEQVGANEAQLARIQTIVEQHRANTNALGAEYRAKTDALGAEYRAGFREILLDTREAIKSVLTPEQAAEYQRLADEWDARQAAERENEEEDDGGDDDR